MYRVIFLKIIGMHKTLLSLFLCIRLHPFFDTIPELISEQQKKFIPFRHQPWRRSLCYDSNEPPECTRIGELQKDSLASRRTSPPQ